MKDIQRFIDELHKEFEYGEGSLIRRKTGKIAGTRLKTGYIAVGFLKSRFLLHRLIYLYHFEMWPDAVDHIDRNKDNNRIENLRSANKSLNEANTGLRCNNTSGYKGVAYHKRAGKWRAYIQCKHIGLFETEHLAAIAYNEEALKVYGDYAYLNEVKK